jgi:RNA polymerase sigma-70 factor (ECF subfamily)
MSRILINLYLGARRARLTHPPVESLAEEDPEFSIFDRLHQPFLLWWSNPEQELVNKLLREDIERALDALPVDYRTVMVLVEINGHSYAEVAEVLGVPIGTVRSRLSRARSLLQRALWTQAQAVGLPSGTRHEKHLHG